MNQFTYSTANAMGIPYHTFAYDCNKFIKKNKIEATNLCLFFFFFIYLRFEVKKGNLTTYATTN